MPVRIYDIAKKFGIESKAVLVKAKELGIAAKVPSSSLDKITAEFLESHFTPPPPAEPPPPPAPEPVIAVAPPVPVPVPVSEPPPAPAAESKSSTQTTQEFSSPAGPISIVTETAPPPAPVEVQPVEPPAPPPPPPGPRVGDKIGFIELPKRPAARGPERGQLPMRGPQRGMTPAPQQQQRGRGDNRFQQRGFQPGGRGMTPAAPSRPAAPARPSGPAFVLPADAKVISLKPPIIVRDLAEKLGKKPFQLIADLMECKVMANVNQAIDETIAQRLCAKYGFKFEAEKRERGGGVVHAPKQATEVDLEDKPEDLKPRAPVVTIMGHVDHGKTSLLDVIRKANVAAGEAGGITQHIGAYTISFPHPERKTEVQQLTFLDTPGHAAFSAMRARGANVTDIVILVVAANDGVMPQTLEALSHAQAAKVPLIVAINKCDHPASNPMKVRQQLQEKGVVPDDWGGETPFVEVSALTQQGVPQLLEMILLRADLLELKANHNRKAKGNIIESGLEPGGPTATVLVRKGTLRIGDAMICGEHYGKVRALINEDGQRLKEAGPSVAVKVLGLNGVPEAGTEFSILETDKAARDLAGQRAIEARALANDEARAKVTLETLFKTIALESAKVLKVVVKADTQGSVEAICEALKKIESEKVSLDIIHSAVGIVTESDVMLASASKGVILGFHTRIDSSVPDIAKRYGVQIKLYSIIYELIDQVKEGMAGLLDPDLKEVIVGTAEVRKLFELSKGGNVAGCAISSGRVVKGKVRIRRRKDVLFEGIIQSLRRFQDEVNEVRAGMECGIRIDGYNDFQVGDVIEAYTTEKVTAKL